MFFDAFYFHCARWICGLTSLPGFYVFAFEPPFVPLYLYFLMEPYYSLFQKLTQFSWGPNEIYVTWFALNNRKMCTKLASFPPPMMFREKNVQKRSHSLHTAAFNHTARRRTLSAQRSTKERKTNLSHMNIKLKVLLLGWTRWSKLTYFICWGFSSQSPSSKPFLRCAIVKFIFFFSFYSLFLLPVMHRINL